MGGVAPERLGASRAPPARDVIAVMTRLATRLACVIVTSANPRRRLGELLMHAWRNARPTEAPFERAPGASPGDVLRQWSRHKALRIPNVCAMIRITWRIGSPNDAPSIVGRRARGRCVWRISAPSIRHDPQRASPWIAIK